jgi:DNA-binding CsgD family transcriptional regulator
LGTPDQLSQNPVNLSQGSGPCRGVGGEGEKQVITVPVGPGLLLVDSAFRVVASNAEVLQMLTFPNQPENITNLDTWLADKVHSNLLDKKSSSGFASEVRSGRRTYLYRSFSVDAVDNRKNSSAQSGKLRIVMFERKSNESVRLKNVSEHFGLTAREQETVRFLLEGFTSKEIGQRMDISANTVKAFIRLVMAKMDVSTRSGIVGRVVCAKS